MLQEVSFRDQKVFVLSDEMDAKAFRGAEGARPRRLARPQSAGHPNVQRIVLESLHQ